MVVLLNPSAPIHESGFLRQQIPSPFSPLHSLGFLHMPDASENRSFVLNFQITIPRARKDENQIFLYSVISIYGDECIFRASYKGEKKSDSKTNNFLI